MFWELTHLIGKKKRKEKKRERKKKQNWGGGGGEWGKLCLTQHTQRKRAMRELRSMAWSHNAYTNLLSTKHNLDAQRNHAREPDSDTALSPRGLKRM
jgi:hypothetical protein